MNRTFDIFCNHCGSKVIVKPFEVKVVCQNCRTYLQIEETETTISTLVIDELTFLELNDSLVVKGRSSQNEIQFYKEELINLEGNWEIELETYKIKNGKKRILPRRNQSMVFLFIAIGMSLVGIYSGLFSKNNNWPCSLILKNHLGSLII